jgi:hypothetical protein
MMHAKHIAHPEENRQLKITIFQEKQFNYETLIRVFKTEESETANTYVGKKGILHTSFTSS